MHKRKVLGLFVLSIFLCSGCINNQSSSSSTSYFVNSDSINSSNSSSSSSFDDNYVYEGQIDNDVIDVEIECLSGTNNCYSIVDNVITFTNISEDSSYSIKGQLDGNIIIDVGDDYKFDLEFHGFSLKSKTTNPILILSGNEVSLKAKKETDNYIYDNREAIDENDESLYKGVIHSEVDLQLAGKGNLSVVSLNNNGIHTKDDLNIKNLSLTVICMDNALKGNDGVEIESGTLKLVAKKGDGIKTSNSDISSKQNQRGIVSIGEANVDIYAACDGIDAAYNVLIDHEDANLNIYTDKYSSYSEEVTTTSESVYYIRFSNTTYQYSVKYYNSDTDYEWVNAKYHSSVGSMGRTYYYYSFDKKEGYSKIRVYLYNSNMTQGQEDNYVIATDYLSINEAYDTFAISSRGNGLTFSWTNYTTSFQQTGPGGHGGGMNEGNQDKSDYSTKGIKAANEIIINNGTINIKSYDDALHSNNVGTLENGETPLGNVTINNGNIYIYIYIYSNDDGIHSDGVVSINGGNISISNSYEGIEGNTVSISNGNISVTSSDDGVNATCTSGVGVTLSGGFIYIYCNGDGIDSNSRSSYMGISFEGGNAVIISSSSGNSAIDTEAGYKYFSGSVVAIMPRGGMANEVTHCSNFSSIGSSKTMSFTSGKTITVSGDLNVSFQMPCSLSNAYLILLNKNNTVSN